MRYLTYEELIALHGFAQGNKRAAYVALEWFLEKNSLGVVTASDESIIAMCFAAEDEKWSVEQIEQWLREHVAL
jgi:death-on-curing family protein